MATPAITLGDATSAHFDAIVRIERASAGGSVVALTGAHALAEALERGHWLVVATAGGETVGWAWFALELVSGEHVGRIYRVAVADEHRRRGVGGALVAHAREVFAARGCTRVRLTLASDDAAARAFFERAGFRIDAITMDQPL
jgi:ribosomal protein S18 acetylase RimI-like enzyme